MVSIIEKDNHSLVKSIARGTKERRHSSMKLTDLDSLSILNKRNSSPKLSNNFSTLAESYIEKPQYDEIDSCFSPW